ncbi:MAG: DNA/pantothenate metabolism flavoprotein [Monoraphidium minutum]|nr:MAG: DNA/pantothenate metabolism flavoprotein [Monoraphidium minutum]
MERNCVRYIDNFSAGTRGAMSTQEFLEAGYAVIFLTRTGSVQPWTLDLPRQDTVALLQERQRLLLTIQFTTIFEYLQYLRAVALAAAPFGPGVMFYLAAAVSDFYIPWSSLAVHKIQSADGPLALNLSKVPKMLGALRRAWAPAAFVVSFKLETDESILLGKASGAVARYGVHAVVANMLHTRKDRVLVVSGGGLLDAAGGGGGAPLEGGSGGGVGLAVLDVRRPEEEPHIERSLVARVVALHGAFRRGAAP